MLGARIWASWRLIPLSASFFLVGCVCSSQLQKQLLADHNPAGHTRECANFYPVRCPDVLQIEIARHPDWTGSRAVGCDGRILLDENTPVLVDGLTPPEIARNIARKIRVPSAQVTVRVSEYRSQQLFVFGEVSGAQRAVAYQGPETILDLLQRMGGIASGAEASEIHVVRPHVADGKPPELYTIDLQAILLDRDQQTNLRLEPSDQIYIGQTRGSRLKCCLPPWIKAIFHKEDAAPTTTTLP